MTARPIVLDPAAPLRSLRDAAGLTQAQLAAARGGGQGAVSATEARGDRVELATLRAYAEAAGLVLELRVRPA